MSVVSINKENFKEVVGGAKPALVEFYAPWCGFCRRIAPAFEKAAEQYAEKLAAGQINIEDSPELAEAYKVEVVPTLVIFDKGEPVGDIVSPESKEQIDDFIRRHI